MKDLSHPVNVGRDFLGRYQGKLKFGPNKGYLEIQGSQVQLISKRDELLSSHVTDSRLRAVMDLPAGRPYSAPHMGWRGAVNQLQVREEEGSRVFPLHSTTIPAGSATFVPLRVDGKTEADVRGTRVVVIEPKAGQTAGTFMLPGVCSVVGGVLHGFV